MYSFFCRAKSAADNVSQVSVQVHVLILFIYSYIYMFFAFFLLEIELIRFNSASIVEIWKVLWTFV